jgi:hypothetical protein
MEATPFHGISIAFRKRLATAPNHGWHGQAPACPWRLPEGPRANKFAHATLAAIVALALALFSLPVIAAEPKATITGGADDTGHLYEWTVTNNFPSPIVRVEIPHYRAGFCVGPDGWKTDETTGIVDAGATAGHGYCIAAAPSSSKGIAAGKSARVRVQIRHTGAKRGPGTVRVRFADGSETLISGVEVPQRGAFGDKYLSLIGLGTIFAALITWKAIRRTPPTNAAS